MNLGSRWWLSGRNPPANEGDMGSISGPGRLNLEKEMATHSSILAWEIPWIEEIAGLQSLGCKRLRHDLLTKQQLQNQLEGPPSC